MVELAPEVAVFGRVSYDLNPLQAETPLEEVRTFERSVGGFAGNVSTGLARLGIPTLIVSAVGDDPHGRYVRAWLTSEGVDVAALGVHPTLRTALAFYESWPPDRFPITLFRAPTAPDWEISLDDLPVERIVRARGLLISGTGLARPVSLAATMGLLERRSAALRQGDVADDAVSAVGGGLTVFDLDWRPMAWADPTEFAGRAAAAVPHVSVLVGGDAEFAAAGLSPEAVAADGRRLVVVKHGPDGSSLMRGATVEHLPPVPVAVTMGLGAGDGFVAALVAGLYEGRPAGEALRRANAAGAIVASRPMCSPAMPTADEIEELLLSVGVGSGTRA